MGTIHFDSGAKMENLVFGKLGGTQEVKIIHGMAVYK